MYKTKALVGTSSIYSIKIVNHIITPKFLNLWRKTMETQKTNISPISVAEALENIKKMREDKSVASEYIKEPFKIPTPQEKVKKRPDGFDYVESAWMDNSFKSESPLYTNSLLWVSESDGWISVLISLTDRTTGNTELGAGAAQIQVAKSSGKILDKGNNLTAALSKAIKNAQSRFGHAADIYRKLQEVPTDDDRERYNSMLTQLKTINLTRSYTFVDQWSQLGTDFTEFLDRWQVYIDRHTQSNQDQNTKKSLI